MKRRLKKTEVATRNAYSNAFPGQKYLIVVPSLSDMTVRLHRRRLAGDNSFWKCGSLHEIDLHIALCRVMYGHKPFD
jgi:hypothetical protein